MSDSLLAWAQRPAAVELLTVARNRIEHGKVGDRIRLTITSSPSSRADLGRLFGLSWQSSDRPATLGLLRQACRSAGSELDELLVAVGGPLRDLVAERDAERSGVADALAAARSRLIEAGVPDAAVELIISRRWAGSSQSVGTADLLLKLARAWLALPSNGTTLMLAELAMACTSSPHGLDRSHELGRLTARALRAVGALGRGLDAEAAAIDAKQAVADSASWRDTWLAAGVVCDRVSSTVLVLNLRLEGDAPAVALANAAALCGDPVWLTARSLSGSWRPAPDVTTVRVCENPSVVEVAADRLGPSTLPLICTFGRPSLAAWALLRCLDAAAVELLISADRDVAGNQIQAELLTGLTHARPWLPEAEGLFEEERLATLVKHLG